MMTTQTIFNTNSTENTFSQQTNKISDHDLTVLIKNFDHIIRQIPPTTKLLCVSKSKPASMIQALHQQGQQDFGENYLQEAQAKMAQLNDCDICWHYIGHIQSNKTKSIAQSFDWVHTVARVQIAKRLNEQRQGLPALNVLIQVNIDNESSKSGCSLDELPDLVRLMAALPNLTLRGLMIIPSPDSTDAFARTKRLFDEIAQNHRLPHWDTLSMGMSADMQDAITNGSTMVRVGSAIFGAR